MKTVLSPEEEQRLLMIEKVELQEEQIRRDKTRKLWTYYPDEGPLSRDKYIKHMSFFEGGRKHRERLFLAANRVGKTEGAGGYEMTCHLTGIYPAWWKGKRFDRAIDAWAAGATSETTRDIIQRKLLGRWTEIGTGLIPADLIVKVTPGDIPESVDTIYVRHVSGAISQISLKSYKQGRKSFEGTFIDVIWLDEEPPLEIYTECLLRTMDTTGTGASDGVLMLTFTPLLGLSETVLQFLPNGHLVEDPEYKTDDDNPKLVIMATWDDVPHLTQRAKDEMWKSIPPFQRDARSKGIPQLGAGAIYPVPESDIAVDDFPIPAHWVRGYSMDVGWNRTSGGFWALDRDTDILYRTSEHYRGEAEPVVHAQGMKTHGADWMNGVIDPASRGRNQIDGRKIFQMYRDLGLKNLSFANNAVEAGILAVWERMSSGRFKVFKSCRNWFFEYRLYRRDEKGRIVKQHDHAMDDTRYFVLSGINRMTVKGAKAPSPDNSGGSSSANGWMG